MEVNENEMSCSDSSSLNETNQFLDSKFDSMNNVDPKCKDNVVKENSELNDDVPYQIKKNLADNIPDQINENFEKLKNSDNGERISVDDLNSCKEIGSNNAHDDHYDLGSKNTENEIGDNLLKGNENNIKAAEDIQEIVDIASEQVPEGDNSKNYENVEMVFLEDERSMSNLSEKNSKIDTQKFICEDTMKINTAEKQLDDHHHSLKKSDLSYDNNSLMTLKILGKNCCGSEIISKDQSEDIQESQSLNRDSEEIERENVVRTFETNNIESSDTSALMKLAEIACETNDTVTSKVFNTFDNTLKVNETDSSACDSTLRANESDSSASDIILKINESDTLLRKNVCNVDVTTLEPENNEILPNDSKSVQEFDEKNRCKNVNDLTQKSIVTLNNNNINNNNHHCLLQSNYCSDENITNDDINTGSESETETLISKKLEEEKANSSTLKNKSDVQEILSTFPLLKSSHYESNEQVEKNLNEVANNKNSLLTENIENDSCLFKNCSTSNIDVDQNECVKYSDVNETKNNLENKIIKIPTSKSNIEVFSEYEQEENLSLEKNLNNKNSKEKNSVQVNENFITDSKNCNKELDKIGGKETSISVEFHTQLNNTKITHASIDSGKQSNSLNKENNFEINGNFVTDDNFYLSSTNLKNVSDTHCVDVEKNSLVSDVCKINDSIKDSSKVSLPETNEEINNINPSKENLSHPSVKETSLEPSSLVICPNSLMEQHNSHLSMLEDNSHSSGFKNDSSSSVVESKLQTPLEEDTPHASLIKQNMDLSVISNISPSSINESTLHSSSLENNSHLVPVSSPKTNNKQLSHAENVSHSLGTENNLQSSATSNKQLSNTEDVSHSLETESNLQSSVIKNDSSSSKLENNLHCSVIESKSYSAELDKNSHLSMIENDLHSPVKENNFPSMIKDNSHSSEFEIDLHSSVKENNLPSVIKDNSHSSEFEIDLHSSIIKDTLHSTLDENNPVSLVSCAIKEHSQIDSSSSSLCPKIYIRKDLHEGYNCDDNEEFKKSLNEKIKSVADAHKTSVRLAENSTKRAFSTTDENGENCSKRICGALNLPCSEESSDEDQLIIDEERTKLKLSQLSKDKDQKVKDYKSKNNRPNSNSENLIQFKNQSPVFQCSPGGKSENNSQHISNTSNLKSMVEVVDLVYDESNEDSISNKPASNLNNDTNYICEKCRSTWNDKVLKLLFEGNESVTVNSRITYGAIICMNIYVSIHYPKIKEQALIGLLDRADLAKNLGSIQVSLLNNWLVTLIKSKKISCCDPFRPVYRAKTLTQVHHSDSLQVGNKEFNDKQKQSVESTVKERNLGSSVTNQTYYSTAEIVIDDDNDFNHEFDERNGHNIDSGIPLSSGKYHTKKISSVFKTGAAILDSKSGVLTNGKAFTKQFANSNPISYSIIQRERESLSSDLHDVYDKLVYESKLTEEEAKTGKRKILTNKEILCMHYIFILNAKEIALDKYYRFLFQLLYHRGNILLIPDEKSLVQKIESIRKEHNRMKFSVAKHKAFLSQSWDIDNICTAFVAKPVNKKNEYNVKVRDILGVFCVWKNSKLLNGNSETHGIREEILKLYENKIEITDCFGLCIKLYANYSRLLFSYNETENMKAKVFLSLFYLPNKYLSSLENSLIFDSEISSFPPTNGNSSEIIDYLEKQTKKGNGQVKRSYLDSVIDVKLQQAKRLKTDLLNSVKSPKAISLIESYAKLKNEMNYLEIESANHQSFKSTDDSHEEYFINSLAFTPEVKLIVAKLRASNVDAEYIPIILEKVFHNIFKRKIPTL